jgi:hypothetical protein
MKIIFVGERDTGGAFLYSFVNQENGFVAGLNCFAASWMAIPSPQSRHVF